MQLVAPAGFVRGRSVGSLFGDQLPRIQRGIVRIVQNSFTRQGMRHPTEGEIKARIDFCIAKAAELYRVLRWSSERIIDELPAALKAHLNNTTWEPSKRMSWTPSDGR
jgi:hypothetical protein